MPTAQTTSIIGMRTEYDAEDANEGEYGYGVHVVSEPAGFIRPEGEETEFYITMGPFATEEEAQKIQRIVAEDPYGSTMLVICEALQSGLRYLTGMSEKEYDVLEGLGQYIQLVEPGWHTRWLGK